MKGRQLSRRLKAASVEIIESRGKGGHVVAAMAVARPPLRSMAVATSATFHPQTMQAARSRPDRVL
jgi:hypothetical protein